MSKVDEARKRNAEFDVQVDPNRLDEEWVGQPSLYFRYGAKLADAQRELEQARNGLALVKVELEQVKAEVDRDVRKSPASFGLDKLTETVVAGAVLMDQRCRDAQHAVLDAQNTVLEAKHRAEVFGAAVEALSHRRKALENLVSLMLANYYSRPKAPQGAKEQMADVEQRAVRARRGGDGR